MRLTFFRYCFGLVSPSIFVRARQISFVTS
jgi:hypothetical protein